MKRIIVIGCGGAGKSTGKKEVKNFIEEKYQGALIPTF